MNPLGSNNPSAFTNIGRGFTQLATAVRDLFKGAYTTVARWLSGAPTRASGATDMARFKALATRADPDPRSPAARSDSQASTPSSPGDRAVTFFGTPSSSMSPSASALPARSDRSEELERAATAVEAWFNEGANRADATNSGNQFLRSNDGVAREIAGAVKPFGPAIVTLARKIVADAAQEVRRQETSGMFGRLSPKQLTPAQKDGILLDSTVRHLIDGARNPLGELAPQEVQFLRRVHAAVTTWNPSDAPKVFPSSLFLRCASPEILGAAAGLPQGIERDLMQRLSNLVTKLATQKPGVAHASVVAGGDPAYQTKFMTASVRFQERIRDLEQG